MRLVQEYAIVKYLQYWSKHLKFLTTWFMDGPFNQFWNFAEDYYHRILVEIAEKIHESFFFFLK